LDNASLAPGVEVPAVMHTVGRLRRSVIADLGLRKHGLELIRPDVRVVAPQPEGPPLTLWSSASRTASDLRARSARDADAYEEFDHHVRSIASFLAYLQVATPPDLKSPSLADAIQGMRLGQAFRRLGAKVGREATRVLPMAVADFVAEAFETDAVRGAIASRAVQFTAMGPWSAGTASVLLNDSAGNDGGAAGQTTYAKGGPAALAAALASAARASGAEIRLGAEAACVIVEGDCVRGVVLVGGE
jgi:phytoene dehydrogenase-like protein